MTEYIQLKAIKTIPRIPIEGNIDLTYRCNNNCRHCWLKIPSQSSEEHRELTANEIKKIVDEAREMGCRRWSMSGGEPMLRPDFVEIFDYITRKSISYSLNTNGTLITPKIAQLLKRKGNKMIVLYGATAEVHDHITRNSGSFEAMIQGCAYLKETGTGFVVQVIPLKDNYHQYHDMIKLAESLSPYWRVGANWLYLSASGDPEVNQEILHQRLSPEEVVQLEQPYVSDKETIIDEGDDRCYSSNLLKPRHPEAEDRIFASCINARRSFHIDPYGQMTFCSFIKEPSLRHDLRKSDFKTCWEEFIPSLTDKVRGGKEYHNNCGVCELRDSCKWCPVYGYLEYRRYTAKVEYLCDIAKENREFKKRWCKEHRRYYQIAGITIQVDSDLPITDTTFHPKFKLFQVATPGKDTIYMRHHFFIPYLDGQYLGKELYRKPPWVIYKKENYWIYVGISPTVGEQQIHQLAVFNHDHTYAKIFNHSEKIFRGGNLHSLTLLPTDQLLLARVLAHRNGCYFHSSGVIFEGRGFLFVGHSEAGKSTIVEMLKDNVKILCDDRIIVRKWPEEFRIHGTWSHGDISDVSAGSAPLKAILFLEKAQKNYLTVLNNKQESVKRLLACLIKPFVTTDWWDTMLSLVEDIVHDIPCYILHFDKSGKVIEVLKQL